jgi:hypothetical protein
MRTLIREARLSVHHRGSVPAIVDEIVRSAADTIRKDDQLFGVVLSTALNKLVRDDVKRSAESDDRAEGLRAGQMEMFPPHARATVEQIGRAEVFVPSRDEFVPLQPGHMTPQEMDEAGKYLIAHGDDCIRRGRALRRLSRIMQPHQKAA